MKKIVLTLLVIISFVIPFHVAAQQNIRLADVRVELLPEYDDPNMLVIYHITLPEGLTYPLDVNVRIPVSGNIHAVAIGPNDDSLVYATYDQQTVGDWTILSIQANLPDTRAVQIDFYDPQLSKVGDQRDYRFNWISDYSIENMRVLIYPPINASQLQVEPDLGSVINEDNRNPYYLLDVGSPDLGDEVHIRLTYQKPDDSLTIESLQVEPSVPINTDGSSQLDLTSLLPWLLGILGIGLLFGGGFWYWQAGRERKPVSKRNMRGARSGNGKQVTGSSTEGIYCHQCGKRAGEGDRFCRSCGEKLRSE